MLGKADVSIDPTIDTTVDLSKSLTSVINGGMDSDMVLTICKYGFYGYITYQIGSTIRSFLSNLSDCYREKIRSDNSIANMSEDDFNLLARRNGKLAEAWTSPFLDRLEQIRNTKNIDIGEKD